MGVNFKMYVLRKPLYIIMFSCVRSIFLFVDISPCLRGVRSQSTPKSHLNYINLSYTIR